VAKASKQMFLKALLKNLEHCGVNLIIPCGRQGTGSCTGVYACWA